MGDDPDVTFPPAQYPVFTQTNIFGHQRVQCSFSLTCFIDEQVHASLVLPTPILSDGLHFIGDENAFIMTWDIQFLYFIPLGLTKIPHRLILRLVLLQNRH